MRARLLSLARLRFGRSATTAAFVSPLHILTGAGLFDSIKIDGFLFGMQTPYTAAPFIGPR